MNEGQYSSAYHKPIQENPNIILFLDFSTTRQSEIKCNSKFYKMKISKLKCYGSPTFTSIALMEHLILVLCTICPLSAENTLMTECQHS